MLIHRAPAYNVRQRPVLIDTTAKTTSVTDAALAVGRTFTDPASGISITLRSLAAGGATVAVDVP